MIIKPINQTHLEHNFEHFTKSKSTGSKENGTYTNPNYDRWGNKRSADGKVNKWDKWDTQHV